MHSKKYEMIRDFYLNGFWSKKKVHDAVIKSWITAAEYEEIVGEPYIA